MDVPYVIRYNDNWTIEFYISNSGSGKITWGEPALICQTRMDKECPWCGKRAADGFQMGKNDADEIDRAWCQCGFSF